MTEQKTLREKLHDYLYSNGMSERYDCQVEDILSLMLKEVEGARLTDEQIKLAAHNFTDTDYKYLKNVMETYPIQQFKGSAYNDAAQKLEWGKIAAAQLEAVKKILGKV
jgi:hypothetical protein